MATEYIKEFSGRILGTIETDASGNAFARDFSTQQILGFYKKQIDCTTDFMGKILARGNILAALIYNKNQR